MEPQKYCTGANNQVLRICPQGYAKTNDGQCVPETVPAVRIAHDKEEEECSMQTTPVWNYVLGGIAGVLLIVCIALAAKKANAKK